MSPLFTKKKIDTPHRVCLNLKRLRTERGISIERLAERTKISKDILHAIEECRFADADCETVYLKKIIARYAEALGADPSPLLAQYWEEEEKYRHKKTAHPGRGAHRRHLRNMPMAVRFAALACVSLALLGFIGLHIGRTLATPSLSVAEPKDGLITEQSAVIVQGTTEPEINVMINGIRIKNSEQGKFNETLALTPGINTLTITAENKFGRQNSVTRRVIYKG